LDREDRWNLYLKENIEKEKSRLDQVDPLVETFADAVIKKKFRRIADVGCGLGRHSLYLSRMNFQVLGCDISESVLQLVEQIAASRDADLQFIQADYMELPFFNEVIGGVVAVDTLHHDILENIIKALKEIHRVLVPGGILGFNPLSTRDELFGNGRKLGEKLYIIHRLPHYFFDQDEIEQMLNRLNFKIDNMELHSYRQVRNGKEYYREKFNIIARKVSRKKSHFISLKQPLL
jgi:ubiquinone/menaquinone biosynthesis C-methylase UbiE